VVYVVDKVVVDILGTWYDGGFVGPAEVGEHDRVAGGVRVHVVPDCRAG